MSDERRQRLAAVILPLVGLDDFSPELAKQTCSEARPAYVTRTIGQLVDDGVLIKSECDGDIVYRWVATKPAFEPAVWIESKICGTQIKQSPEKDRPRERLMRSGVRALSESDLLAILIRVGVTKESAVVAAQKIANRFADRIDDLPKCTVKDLKDISVAIRSDSYCQIMAGIELGRRIADIKQNKISPATRITSTAEAIAYCEQTFRRLAIDAVQEEFHIVTLDTKHKPIQTHCITIGTLDASLVHPREVFHPAIRDSASAVLLVHNHPSGDPTPSREDHQVTDRLTEAGKILGINVLDHIVVAKQRCLSIRECS